MMLRSIGLVMKTTVNMTTEAQELRLSRHEQEIFFDHQMRCQELENQDYYNSTLEKLIKTQEAFIAKPWSILNTSQLIIKMRSDSIPRANMSHRLSLMIGTVDRSKTYKELWLEEQSIIKSTTSMYMLKVWRQEGDSIFFICDHIDDNFLKIIRAALMAQKRPPLLISKLEPPFQYLKHLQAFVRDHSHPLLRLEEGLSLATWKPQEFTDSMCLVAQILISQEPVIIVQGPPGTGKSYLIAELLQRYNIEKKSVMLCALTHQALLAIATKPQAQVLAEQGALRKTGLTEQERAEAPHLRDAQDLSFQKESALLTTFFQATSLLKELATQPKADVIIVDEASQAHYPMLIGLISLSSKIIIVGDPAQLSPVKLVHKSVKPLHARYDPYIQGLDSLSRIIDPRYTYSLTTTFRLSPTAAKLTSIFYPFLLSSVTTYQAPYYSIFGHPSDCGTICIYVDSLKESIDQINQILSHIFTQGAFKIAVLTPYIVRLQSLQQSLRSNLISDTILIETVDRIQGLTVDLCIYELTEASLFGYQEERFNVATSRSRGLTVILLGEDMRGHSMRATLPVVVQHYLVGCIDHA